MLATKRLEKLPGSGACSEGAHGLACVAGGAAPQGGGGGSVLRDFLPLTRSGHNC